MINNTLPVTGFITGLLMLVSIGAPGQINPYAASLNTWLEEKHERPFDREYSAERDAQTVAGDILRRAWGLTHPLSDLEEPELIAWQQERLAEEIEYVLTAAERFEGRVTGVRSKNNIERFTLRNFLDALNRLKKAGLFTDQIDGWIARARLPVQYQFVNYWKGPFQRVLSDGLNRSAGSYANSDAMFVDLMGTAYQLYGAEEYKERAQEFVTYLEKDQFPGGGFNYNYDNHEIINYHGLVISCLGRYWKTTGDSLALRLLKRSVDYYPLTLSASGLAEKSTHCWWKRQMHMSASAGPIDIVAAVTGDGRNKYLAGLYRAGADAIAVDFWRDDIEPVPPADNRIYEDPNINGFRGRFGTFSWLGMLGNKGAGDTFAGAMISFRKDGNPSLNALMELVTPEIILNDGRTSLLHNTAYTTGPEYAGDYLFTSEFGALAASYQPWKPWKSRTEWENEAGEGYPWAITQFWLMLPGQLLASVSMECREDHQETAVRTRIRFAPHGSLKKEATGLYSCNDLRVRLLEHNYPADSIGDALKTASRFPQYRFGDELFLTATGPEFLQGERYSLKMSVHPSGVNPGAEIEHMDLAGMEGATIRSGEYKYLLVFNPCNSDNDLELDVIKSYVLYHNMGKSPAKQGKGIIKEIVPAGSLVVIRMDD